MAAADIDCLVIGAGVVGLAVARKLALAGREVVVLEAEASIGHGISSRNSEVIHAGIYYPKDSLKARFCVEGRKALYYFCASHGVAHRRCGKILVAASEDQRDQVLAIQKKAAANGVDDLRLLDAAAMRAMEPEVQGVIGLHSPSTGIIDSHSLMLALQGDLEAAGGAIAFRTGVVNGGAHDELIELETAGETGGRITAAHVVLASGLSAPRIARSISGIAPQTIPQSRFAKGNYFSLSRRAPFSRLVYPVPEPGGLGTHLTIDLSGRGRFGPDVEWLATDDERTIDYRVDPARSEKFYAAIRRYWPGLRDGELTPDYSGVRPKLTGPGEADADFCIQDAATHGVTGLVALYGIESPGLTSSLAIADYVAQMVLQG
jgi:L-2-hydroxyglutarate oxidase LhgO